jgi:hypothetical protein
MSSALSALSDDDDYEEEGTAHNLAHVSLIAQAQHNIKHCMRYSFNLFVHFQRDVCVCVCAGRCKKPLCTWRGEKQELQQQQQKSSA